MVRKTNSTSKKDIAEALYALEKIAYINSSHVSVSHKNKNAQNMSFAHTNKISLSFQDGVQS